jgi:hypothetical protein
LTNISGTVATKFIEQPTSHVEFDSQSFASQTSYAQALLNGEEGMVLPPPPLESEDEAPFECPYCFVIISISGNNAWARHVFNDLMPYICVFPDCQMPHRRYESRREWYYHLHSQHSVPDEPGGFFDCSLCTSSVATGKSFQRHVAQHLEELALFALPRYQPEANHPQLEQSSTRGRDFSEGLDPEEDSLSRENEYTDKQSEGKCVLAQIGDAVLKASLAGLGEPLPGIPENTLSPSMKEDVRIKSGDDVEIPTHVVKSERPIIFTDPTGIQFDFPLEGCKIWQV